MIDIRRITYQTAILTADGQALDANELLQSLSWEDNPGELAQRANLAFKNQAYGSTWLSAIAVPGAQFFIYADWGQGSKEIFQGPIWNYNYDSSTKKELTNMAYDNLIYHQKSKDYRWYAAGTSSKTMLMDIFNEWGIPVGKYEGPDVPMGKKVFKGKYIADMVMEILDDARKKGAGKFIARSVQGKAQIIPRGSNTDVYVFEAGENVVMTGHSMDLDDLITRVKIIGKEDKDERAPVEAVMDGKTEFGILQDVVQRNQDDTLVAAKASAQAILEERGTPKITRKLQSPDLPFLRKGDKISVSAGSLSGYFYVKGVQHDATNQIMTMEVEE
ncbi:hypothetical protein [Petroclostridium sp. X23]|uniref:XkdQ/YqbQ family protein n=1 Tax=Petroclostridium sp. X23 TaxID=3045146 RepID=UPI0024AC9180|nr:hypothetical protein [Petroclostridium sp. X23]WHH58315.1 hypothetical protein QKW49_21325 [Petroclostridium sp. X23]